MATKRKDAAPVARVRSYIRGMHYDYSRMPVKKRKTSAQTTRTRPYMQSTSEDASEAFPMEDSVLAIEKVSCIFHLGM